MRWQLLTCAAHFAVALRATETVTNAEYGILINYTVDGATVFSQSAGRPGTPKFESKWTNADDVVTATVSGLFTIVGTFERSNQYSGILTVTSATIEELAGVPKKMIDGVKKWAAGVQLTVKFGLTTAQITGENVFMELSNGKIALIAYGELVDCKVDEKTVYSATAGKYSAKLVWFKDATVVAVVDGLYTMAGKYRQTETQNTFTVTSMEISDNATDPVITDMVTGLRKWKAGVELSVQRDALYSIFIGEKVKMKFARMAVHKGDLLNCRRNALPIYQKDVDASYKYKFSWVQRPNENDDQIVTIKINGLCTIGGTYLGTLDDPKVGKLTLTTTYLESSGDPDAENMVGGLAAWTLGNVLTVTFGETLVITGNDIQLEFRNEV